MEVRLPIATRFQVLRIGLQESVIVVEVLELEVIEREVRLEVRLGESCSVEFLVSAIPTVLCLTEGGNPIGCLQKQTRL